MASTITNAFIEQYNADAHNAYQRHGFKMQRMTRSGTVRAKTVYWQVIGTLTAQDKPRNAMHNFQDMPHSTVSAAMVDKYVPTIIDDLDLLKLNIDERRLHAENHMHALGRWSDEQIRDVMNAGAGSTIGPGNGVALTVDHMLEVPEFFNLAEVPDDGGRFCMVRPKVWSKMLKVDEFSNADYVGTADLPFRGMTAKRWAGVMWLMDTLPSLNTGNDVASNLVWHSRAVGHGSNKEFETKITFENLFSAHVAVSEISQGAEVIDPVAVAKWDVDEAA